MPMLPVVLAVALAAQAAAPPATFDAVSIRKREGGTGGTTIRPQGGYVAPNVAVQNVVTTAYNLRNVQLIGGPEWIRTDRYDILARATGNPSREQLRPMLQAMLTERFKFAAHWEKRDMQGYRLVLVQPGRLGPKMQVGGECSLGAARPNGPCLITFQGSSIIGRGMAVRDLLGTLEARMGGPVTDDTGLNTIYDFDLQSADVSAEANPNNLPPLVTALQEQLGLKLEPTRVTLDILVIDSIERPTEN